MKLLLACRVYQTIFWRIPIRSVDQDRILNPEKPRGDASDAVLIAEDDPLFRRVLQSQLQSWGYQVITAEDGTDAWEYLQQPKRPDLLILDWMMPGANGIELCRRIREEQHDRYQYILLVSGKDEKHEIVEGLEAGADDYLTKPFDIGELRARLRAGKRILSLQHDLIQAREELRFRATHDDLTGLWSRGATLDLLGYELRRGARSRTPTGILLIDLDHFKNVNDTYGHLIGDTVLREAGSRINHAVRSYDFVGRYGGEEFLAVLSKCTPDDLQRIAERVRDSVARSPISTKAGDIGVTASIGCAVTYTENTEFELLSTADSALYEAKRAGRNRFVIGSCEGRRLLKKALAGTSEPVQHGENTNG